MSRKENHKKRRIAVTPEPNGGRRGPTSPSRIFVVQKHRATQLHYDFRLNGMGRALRAVLKACARSFRETAKNR
jgi:hypothetical protein